MRLISAFIFLILTVMTTGCVTQNEHGICDTNTDIMWTYTKEQGLVGTNRWCLHCNHTIEEADLPSYIGQYWPSAADASPTRYRRGTPEAQH